MANATMQQPKPPEVKQPVAPVAPIAPAAGQRPVAAIAPEPRPAFEGMSDAKTYLESNGWIEDGINELGEATWSDPRGTTTKPVKVDGPTLRTVGGGKEVIKQSRGNVIPWSYTTREAFGLQRQRDKYKTVAKTV